MLVLKSRPNIIISFEKSIMVLNVEPRAKAEEIPSFKITFELVTSDTRVSFDERILAVAMAPNDSMNTVINIYNIDYTSNQFIQYHSVAGISSSIHYMDFSSDNVYLMYMDNVGNKEFLDLKEKQAVRSDRVENVEWIGEGLKISNKRAVVSLLL